MDISNNNKSSYNFKERKSLITNNIESNRTSCYEFKSRKQDINDKMLLQNLTEFPVLDIKTETKTYNPFTILSYDKLKESLNKEDIFIEKNIRNKNNKSMLPLPPKMIPQYIKQTYDWSKSKHYITYPIIIV